MQTKTNSRMCGCIDASGTTMFAEAEPTASVDTERSRKQKWLTGKPTRLNRTSLQEEHRAGESIQREEQPVTTKYEIKGQTSRDTELDMRRASGRIARQREGPRYTRPVCVDARGKHPLKGKLGGLGVSIEGCGQDLAIESCRRRSSGGRGQQLCHWRGQKGRQRQDTVIKPQM
jgi:hypothetical protein